MRITHCRMCLASVEPVLDLGRSPIANSFADEPDVYALNYPLGLSQCGKCGHVQISWNVPGEVLFSDYKYRTPEAERARLAEQSQVLARKYPKAVGDRPLAVEIGSNNGIFIKELQKVGIQCIGVDPTSKNFKWFNSKTGRQLAETFGKMKLIVSNNTLAHVDDLRNVLLGIHYLLDDDGVLVFEVQYLPKMIAGGMFDMVYHEHKDYHQLKTWPYLLAKFGMVVSDYEFLPTHGGSIRVHVKRGDKGIDLPNETINWEVFKKKIEFARNDITGDLKKPGRVVAFGATAKACTLIHYFGIKDRIAYCVDETLEKQGKYIPGTSIEICSPERMDREPPDAVLLTAWNYAEVIRPRFKCEVIVPFQKAA